MKPIHIWQSLRLINRVGLWKIWKGYMYGSSANDYPTGYPPVAPPVQDKGVDKDTDEGNDGKDDEGTPDKENDEQIIKVVPTTSGTWNTKQGKQILW